MCLARRSLEYYVHEGRMIPFGRAEEGLPEEMLPDKGGSVVSVRKGGALRGCIGTIAPVCRNIAEEIIQNAVSAGIHDPRFLSVRRGGTVFSLNTAWMCWGRQSRFRVRTSWTRCVTASLSPRAEKGDCCFPIWRGVDTVRKQLSIASKRQG